MSRHDHLLEASYELSYGWDRGMASFFVQVYDPDGEIVKSVGCDLRPNDDGRYVEVSPRTISELNILLDNAGMSHLSNEQEGQLIADRMEEGMELNAFEQRNSDMLAEAANIIRRPRDEALRWLPFTPEDEQA